MTALADSATLALNSGRGLTWSPWSRGGQARESPARGRRVWGLLTFDRLITGPVIHLVYWCGLGVIAVATMSVVGASIGVAWREGSWAALLLALPVLVVGLLVVAAMALIWRAFLRVLRGNHPHRR